MESPSFIDYSSSMEMPSGTIQQQTAFDDALFDKQENDPEMSLQVLANCVNLVNCTILKERGLLPEEFFMPFRVYGDIFGYMLDQTHPQAKKVLNKVNSIDVAIRRRQVYKVALVVEEVMNTNPAETFIWSFAYGEGVTAEIGYHGNTSSFNVNYKDMATTCKQFCSLFNEIQLILGGLGPMPLGMVPSIRVAYRGDPEFSVGFQPIEKFVEVDEIGIGAVAFPYSHKFHMSYASEFVTDCRSNTRQSPDMERMNINDRVSFDNPVSSPVLEVTRHETMEQNEPEDNGHDSPVFEDRHIDDDLMSGLTTHFQPNKDTENVLPSEINEFAGMDDMDVDGLYGNLEESREQLVELNERQFEKSPELRVSPKKRSEQLVEINEKPSEKTPEPKVAPKKRPSRFSSSKKQKKFESPSVESSQKKKTPAKKAKKTAPEQQEERNPNEPVEKKKKSARRLEVPAEPPVAKKYGRMPSLLGLNSTLNVDQPEEQAAEKKGKRYGRVSSIRSHAETSTDATLQESPLKLDEPKAVEQVDTNTPMLPQRFGRVRTVKNIFEKQTPRYGRGPRLSLDESEA